MQSIDNYTKVSISYRLKNDVQRHVSDKAETHMSQLITNRGALSAFVKGTIRAESVGKLSQHQPVHSDDEQYWQQIVGQYSADIVTPRPQPPADGSTSEAAVLVTSLLSYPSLARAASSKHAPRVDKKK